MDTPVGVGQFFEIDGQLHLYDASTGNWWAIGDGTSPPILLSTTGEFVTFSFGDGQIDLSQQALNALFQQATTSSTAIYHNASGAFSDQFQAVSYVADGIQYLALADTSGTGIAIYQFENGAWSDVQFIEPEGSIDAAQIAGLAQISTPNGTIFLTVSASHNNITSYSIQDDGTLTPVATLGVDQFLPIQTPQGVSAFTIDDQQFCIVASAGSSSLTVFAIDANGGVTAVDQVTDDLATRFQGVTTMEVFNIGEHVYVLAAGQDSGLSLFTVLPNGQLVHIDTIVDSQTAPLDTISDIHVVSNGDTMSIYTVSGSEVGIGHFTLDVSDIGVVATQHAATGTGTDGNDIIALEGFNQSVNADGGDDILIDGIGQDTLTGGSGADLFILLADGQTDTITDFQPGVDRLDLSQFTRLYAVSQLQITSLPNGAIIQFGDEELIIYTSNGSSLSASDFTTQDILNAGHVDLGFVQDDLHHGGIQSDVTRFTLASPSTDLTGQLGSSEAVLMGDVFADTLWGSAGAQTLVGDAGHDILRGGDGADILLGGDGIDIADYSDATAGIAIDLQDPLQNTGFAAGDQLYGIEAIAGSIFADTLDGDAWDNLFFGGNGDDTISAYSGDDRLDGDGGQDRLIAGDGDDTLSGNQGNDRLEGGTGNDNLFGGSGEDALLGHDGHDVIYGGDGDDNIAAHWGSDTVYGGAGNDSMGGSNGHDQMYGGAGNDTIGSGSHTDVIDAGAGDDVASGGWGTDHVMGGDGDDTLAGSYNDDTVNGGSGHDSIGGGHGSDTMLGGSGDDMIGAGDDDDFIFGGAGDDFLAGGNGNDVIFAGSGDDRLNAGNGNSTMSGGSGADLFIINTFTDGAQDTITDFEDGTDLIRLRGVDGRFSALDITTYSEDGIMITEIEYEGHIIRLEDTNGQDIGVDDFVFIG